MRIKFNNWLVLLLSAIVSFLLIIGGHAYYRYEEKKIRSEKYNELKAIAGLKINQIVQWRKDRFGDASSAAQNYFFSKELEKYLSSKNNPVLKKDIQDHLVLLQKLYSYNNVFITSPQGKLIVVSDPGLKLLDTLAVNFIKEAIGQQKILFTDFYYCEIHHQVHFDIIAPVMGSKNLPIATLVFRVAPADYLYPLIQSWPTPNKTAETLLIRKEGDSVVYVNDLKNKANAALKLKISMKRKEVPAVQAVLGFSGIFEGNDYIGQAVLSEIRPIPNTPWFMIAKINKNEIFSELDFMAFITITMVTLLILLFGVGLAWIYHFRQKSIYKALFLAEKNLHEKEEEFRTTLYSIGDGVITTDLKGKICQMNPVAERLTGWKEKDAIGKPLGKVYRIVNEETREAIESPVEKILREESVIGLANPTLLLSKNGKEIPITDSGAPIKTKTNKIMGVVLVFRDQSSEREAEKELRKSEEYFRNVFEHAAVGKSITSLEGKMNGNQALQNILGYTSEELSGLKWQNITHPDDIEFNTEVIRSIISGEKNSDCWEKRFIHKTGCIVWANITTSLQRDKDGKPIFFISTIIDITGRKQMEENLRKGELLYRNLFENMLNGFAYCKMIFDDGIPIDFVYLNVNRSFESLTGLKDVAGKKVSDVIPGILESDKELIGIYGRVALTGNPETFEIYMESLQMWFFISVYSPDKEYFVAIFDVITERKQSETKLRDTLSLMEATLESTNNGILVIGPKGNIIRTNNKFVKMWKIPDHALGSIEDEKLMKHIQEQLIEPGTFFSKVMELRNSQNTDGFDLLYFKDGRVFERVSKPMFVGGEVKGRVLSFLDITRRKLAEEALEKEQYLMNTLMENAPDHIYFKDHTSHFIRINNAHAKSFKMSDPVDAIGKTDFDFFTEEHAREAYNDELYIIRTGLPIIKEEKETWSDRPNTWVSTTKLPLYDKEGKIIGTFGISSDITQRKEAEILLKEKNQEIEAQNEEYLQINEELLQTNEELKAAKERAEESDHLKTSFLQNMSHEIRTPMNAIMGFSQLLPDQYNNKTKLEHYSEIINQRCNDLLELINGILEIAKIESGKSSVHIENCDLNILFNELGVFFEEQKKHSGKQNIKFSFQPLISPSGTIILTDKVKLNQIFINLIGNAFKFTENGKIEFGGKLDGKGNLVFFVSDTGIGIPAKKQKIIFERFTQLGHGPNRLYGGTGLGLSIVKGLVNLLDGTIGVESEPAKGSTFYFSIPYKPAQPLKIETVALQMPENYHFSDKVILLVEDDPYNAEYLKEILSFSGFNIIHSEYGNEAVQIALTSPIDLILMDIRLPDMEGYEAIRQIKNRRPQIKIIVQTAYASQTDKKKAFDAGCIDYISKPVKRELLLSMINKQLANA
jgi:PAS domain S-box-containing protein